MKKTRFAKSLYLFSKFIFPRPTKPIKAQRITRGIKYIWQNVERKVKYFLWKPIVFRLETIVVNGSRSGPCHHDIQETFYVGSTVENADGYFMVINLYRSRLMRAVITASVVFAFNASLILWTPSVCVCACANDKRQCSPGDGRNNRRRVQKRRKKITKIKSPWQCDRSGRLISDYTS